MYDESRRLLAVILGVFIFVASFKSLGHHESSGAMRNSLTTKFTYSPWPHVCRGDPIAVEMTTMWQTAEYAANAVEAECAGMDETQLSRCEVPPVLHLVLGYPGKFDFYAYISVKSAHDRLNPDNIYMHVFGQRFDPSPYLERAIDEFGIKLVSARDVTEVMGRKVDVVEHRSDVIRLESLIRFGGIYIDLDAFILQPLDVFYKNELTMPAEGNMGVNNGLIIAKRCSRFLRNWYKEYQRFDDSQWGDHSIFLPKKLAEIYPDWIKVEQESLQSDFTDTYDRLMSDNLEREYWEPVRAVHSFIRLSRTRYDEESIEGATNNFGRMVRRIMDGKPGMLD